MSDKPTSDINYARARLSSPFGILRAQEDASAFGLGQIFSAGVIALAHHDYLEKENASLLSKLQAAEKERDELREALGQLPFCPDMARAIFNKMPPCPHRAALAASQDRIVELESVVEWAQKEKYARDGRGLSGHGGFRISSDDAWFEARARLDELLAALSLKSQEGNDGK